MLQQALSLRRLGFDVTLVRSGGKGLAFRNGLRPFSSSELSHWLRRRRFNIGIVLGQVVVIDVDEPSGMDWARNNGLDQTPMAARSPHGHHFYFRTKTRVRTSIKYLGLPVDIKASGHIVAPPSSLDSDEAYGWIAGPVRADFLPLVSLDLQQLHDRFVPPSLTPNLGRINDPKSYCLKIPSVQGQNGSKALMRCCYVCLSNGLSFDQAHAFLSSTWNEANALPRWSEQEIRRALTNALRRLSP